MSDRDQDAFYVGYLPLPRAMRPFVRGITALLALVAIGVGVALATAQPPAGDGSWAAEPVLLEGVLTADPYPMLHAPDPDQRDRNRAWLLVGSGKTGTRPRTEAALDGAPQKRVRVHGQPLRRRGQRALSLVDGDSAIEVLGDAEPPKREAGEAVTVVGEIIDPKCWLGAMRPGSGLVHRACASLCIRGGIPPCFVGGPAGQQPRFYVITDRDGRPCNEAVADLCGVLVTMQATTESFGAAELLRTDVKTIAAAHRDG